MSRYLKVLGLALVAVFAMSAMAASGAMAQTQGFVTADGPFTLTGEDEILEEGPGFFFHKGDEAPVECAEAHYLGEAHDGGDLASGATSTTITPTYGNCLFVQAFPTHVDTSACDYDLDIGKTIATNVYSVTAGVTGTCVVTIYLSVEATEAKQAFCTLEIGEQGISEGEEKNSLLGATVTDETNGHLTLGGEIEGIHIQKSGACGEETSTTGSLELSATVEGLDAEGGETPVTISDEEEE